MEEESSSTSSTSLIDSTPMLAERFEVIKVLGEGAAGAVYRVRDRQRNGRDCALKVLTNSSAFDEHTLARFKQELMLQREIRHQHVVHAYDLIETNSLIAFTLEYIDGCDLGKMLKRRRLQPFEIEKIFSQILDGLGALHQRGIIHRDMKLENILVATDGTVKVSDLGLVKQLAQKGLTRTGILLGTPQYLPPEYVRHSHYDIRGDLYAVGFMLLECLTDQRWLNDKVGMQALEFRIKKSFEIPSTLFDQVPRKYLSIVRRALSIDPASRYFSASDMKAALLEAKDDSVKIEMKSSVNLRADTHLRLQKKSKPASSQFWSLLSVIGFTGLVSAIGFTAFESEIRGNTVPTQAEVVVQEKISYVGSLLFKGNSKSSTVFKLDIRGQEMHVQSGLKDCTDALVNLEDGIFLCGKSEYRIDFEQRTPSQIIGRIIDKKRGVTHAFKAIAKSSL